jgi:hypothetical protein
LKTRSKVFLLPLCLGTLIVAPSLLHGQSLVDTPFTRQVLSNFSSWDTDHDGVLSSSEIDSRITDRRVTGEAAATLSALKVALRSSKEGELPLFRRDYFSQYARGFNNRPVPSAIREEDEIETDTASRVSAVTSAAPTAPPKFDSLYRRGLGRIMGTGPEIFLFNDPRLDHVKQRHVSDCFFLAVVGAMIQRDPKTVRNMIQAQRDGSCIVTFPGKKPVRIPPLTDTQICLYGSTSSGARWLMLLEEGFGQANNELHPAQIRHEIASDYYIAGGSPTGCLQVMTGHQTNGINLRLPTVDPMPTREEVELKLEPLRQALTDAFRERRLVTVGTTLMSHPPGITQRHSFAVLGYDPASDSVQLWNPHRNNFRPQGPSGLTYGYPTRGGIFIVPLSDFARIFSRVSWETDKPLVPRS